MFGKSKVSQSMIDAVNKVLGEQPIEQKDQLLNEAGAPIKEPTSTGMRVYGGSYGNSAKAKKDQTKSPVDNLKGPKTKELIQMNKEETINEVSSSEVKHHFDNWTNSEHAPYNSDAGDDNKVHQSALRYLRSTDVPKEKHEKLAMHIAHKFHGSGIDEAAKPDFLDMDKDGNKKESMKKAIADKSVKEELKGNQHRIDANNNNKIDAQDFKILKAKKKVKEGREFTEKLLEMVRKSDVPAYLRKAKGDTPLTMADVKGPKKDTISDPKNLAKARNEEVEHIEEEEQAYEPSNAAITTDTLAGRMPGGKFNSFKSFKTRVSPLSRESGEKPGDDTPEIIQPQDTPARKSHEVKEATIAGLSGFKRIKKDVTDKSGAVHTPMSRARDLAQQALKTVQNKTKVK
jgi:hypothetical protein